MNATMAVSLHGQTPTTPCSVQGSFPRRRRRVNTVSVRALKNGDDGGDTGKTTEMSRRALFSLIALSSVQIGGLAWARGNMVVERRRVDSLRDGQRKSGTSEDTPSPAPPVVSASGDEISLVSSLEEAAKAVLSDAGTVVTKATLPQEAVSEAIEVSSSVNNGLGLLSLAGVLGTAVGSVFYNRERQSKTQAESAVDAANKKLEEAAVSMESIRKSSEGQLLAEKEQAQKAASIAQEQRTTLANELMASRTSVAELENQLITEKAAVGDLQKKIARLQATLGEQEKSSNSLHEKFLAEREVCEQLRSEISRLQADLAAQESSYESVNARLVEEAATGEQLRVEIRALELTIEAKENEIVVRNGRIKEGQDSIAELQAQLRKTEAQLASEKGNVASLHDQLINSESQLSDERSILRNLESSYASSQDRNQQLEISIGELRESFESTVTAKEELVNEVGRLNTVIGIAKRTLAEELEKKEILIRQLRETTGAFEEASAEVKSFEHRISEMAADKIALEKEKNDEISHLNRELEEKRKSLDVAVGRNQVSSDEIIALRSRQADLNQELEHSHQELEASTNEIRTISEQLTVAVSLSLKLETQLNETRSLYQSTSAALVEERKVTAAAKNQLAMSQRSLVAEKNSVKALRGSVDQALQALQELNQDSVALADELDKAKKRIANLESETASARQKLVKEKEISANLRAGNAQADSNISKLVKENDAANKKVKLLEGELLKGKGELARQKGKLLEQKRALQQAETRLKMVTQVRAEDALLVEKYEDLAFQEKVHKEPLILQNEKLHKNGKNVGADLTDIKQSLEDGKAARSDMEAAIGSLQEVVADTSS